jgi:hypothetical protein
MKHRVSALEARFAQIAQTRMQGVPMLNERLHVQALGFAPQGDEGWVGVLITPWFMNLVWLPYDEVRLQERPPTHGARDARAPEVRATEAAAAPRPTPVGATRRRQIGNHVFAFIGAFEEDFGAYEACSLFSPMFEFVDQAAAVATGIAVMQILREPASQDKVTTKPVGAPPLASRRAWLFGPNSAGRAPTAPPPRGVGS